MPPVALVVGALLRAPHPAKSRGRSIAVVVVIRTVAVYSLRGVLQDMVRNLLTGCAAITTGRPEVNAAKDAGIGDFIERIREVGERTGHAGHHIGIYNERSFLPKEVGEHGGSRAAGRRMA